MFYKDIKGVRVLLFSLLLCSMPAFSQKAKDILENGIEVKSRDKIFLRLEGDKLKYDIGTIPSDFITIEDAYFLVSRSAINVYLKPLNPLDYSYTTGLVFSPDQVSEDASNILGKIISLLSKPQPTTNQPNANPNEPIKTFPPVDPNCSPQLINSITDTLRKIANLLTIDKKAGIVKTFQELKNISFDDEISTKDDLKSVSDVIQNLETFYKIIGISITKVDEDITTYNKCTSSESFISQYIFFHTVKELKEIQEEQIARLENLKKAFNLVKKVQQEASRNKDGINWYINLGEVAVNINKISQFTVIVNEDGFKLSEKNEIVKADKKELISTVLKMRRFQRFVPEVSAGTAYTFLSFPKYGTTTDAAGKMLVADAGNETFKQVSITAMLNFNLFLPNSPLHPFFQLGIGENSDYPVLFVGAGFRISAPPLKRLAIAAGFASTWIKKLNQLKIGSPISGTAELEKDITYEFQFPLKPYLGIQYNF